MQKYLIVIRFESFNGLYLNRCSVRLSQNSINLHHYNLLNCGTVLQDKIERNIYAILITFVPRRFNSVKEI